MKQILITTFIFISFKMFSQTDTTPSHKIFSLNLIQFAFREMRLTYERPISNELNLAYSIGFRLQQKNALVQQERNNRAKNQEESSEKPLNFHFKGFTRHLL